MRSWLAAVGVAALAATVRGESLFYRDGGLPEEHLRALGLSPHEYCSGALALYEAQHALRGRIGVLYARRTLRPRRWVKSQHTGC
jgi:hypothetical protein